MPQTTSQDKIEIVTIEAKKSVGGRPHFLFHSKMVIK